MPSRLPCGHMAHRKDEEAFLEPMKKRPISMALRTGFASLMIAAAAAPQAVAQPALPSLGEGGALTAGAERRLGERIARELYRDPDYLDDAVLAEYVRGLWEPLLAAARARGELAPEIDERFAWQILLGRDRAVNAFALPGGYLGLNLGLIGVVESADELASVLAHELSHVTQRHISRLIERQSQQTPLLLGALLLGALAASKNADMANAVVVGGQAVAAQSQLNFSRDMEREADRIGLGVMTQAGFDPRGFTGMFQKLQQTSRLNDNGAFPYLRSHPLTTERIAEMQARQPEAAAPAAKPSLEHALISARARVLSNPGVDRLRAWAAEPEATGFAGLDVARRAAVLYAAALAELQLRQFSQATNRASQLRQLVKDEPRAARLARLLAGQIALAAGHAAEAVRLIEDAVPRGATLPRPERLMLAQGWMQTGQATKAVDVLQPWVVEHPRDAIAWQNLALAWKAQGQALRAVRAEGEAQMAQLDFAGAVDRFKAAQMLAGRGGAHPADDIEASIVDSRLRQAQAWLREQAEDSR